ncbi:sulfurtransferase [Herminiimonas sp. KBW02]|uniref:rhodanese-like domain-containing protein n=1 Tax=Herminiimonas sp. KBW02 TaxID=2153363 RepID=UPI000F596A29|nr:rhodanese-like domain-containing protein [Herminiimonas sp. KBW02]RQO32868.1 sulfurtransferase [Herminiimonas sp. KBW02]
MKKLIAALILGAACVFAWAYDASQVPDIKQTRAGLYLDAKEAYRLKQKLADKAYFVDVRTRGEITYVGMPTIADASIPYVEHPDDAPWDDKNGRFKLDVNSDFGPELARRMTAAGLGKNDTVILICRSGDRSSRAANLLTDLGYTRVYSVVDGFEGDLAKTGPQAGQRAVNGWKNAGLPWSYKLDKSKLYFPRY